ncbi:hypothetical protein AVEN_248886-1 [Araneus ventricosus]|uniref:Uncharacterized protein n=1 Tax=Araneus ventricosus TaxID=182803 RepID=A0A4Y2UED3_ARAVE|nr:hypothetical protein AVEN_47845-1 [Araneus ventricosus]GBO11057.1 hypothetical protein AVEN_248886-1 [Araneus ventricosus]
MEGEGRRQRSPPEYSQTHLEWRGKLPGIESNFHCALLDTLEVIYYGRVAKRMGWTRTIIRPGTFQGIHDTRSFVSHNDLKKTELTVLGR